MIFWKLVCHIFYYLGHLAYKFDDGNCYQFLMSKSFEVDDKYNLGIWKEIQKSPTES